MYLTITNLLLSFPSQHHTITINHHTPINSTIYVLPYYCLDYNKDNKSNSNSLIYNTNNLKTSGNGSKIITIIFGNVLLAHKLTAEQYNVNIRTPHCEEMMIKIMVENRGVVDVKGGDMADVSWLGGHLKSRGYEFEIINDMNFFEADFYVGKVVFGKADKSGNEKKNNDYSNNNNVSNIEYQIANPDLNPFKIGPITGEIITSRAIDLKIEPRKKFIFDVLAVNMGSSISVVSVSVSILMDYSRVALFENGVENKFEVFGNQDTLTFVGAIKRNNENNEKNTNNNNERNNDRIIFIGDVIHSPLSLTYNNENPLFQVDLTTGNIYNKHILNELTTHHLNITAVLKDGTIVVKKETHLVTVVVLGVEIEPKIIDIKANLNYDVAIENNIIVVGNVGVDVEVARVVIESGVFHYYLLEGISLYSYIFLGQ